jgi:hypothetical protein
MQLTHNSSDEAAILARVIEPDKPTLSPAAARSLLELEFTPEDEARMHQLLDRNQQGRLTKQERHELETYRRIGRLIDLLCAKARVSLYKAGCAHG